MQGHSLAPQYYRVSPLRLPSFLDLISREGAPLLLGGTLWHLPHLFLSRDLIAESGGRLGGRC